MQTLNIKPGLSFFVLLIQIQNVSEENKP